MESLLRNVTLGHVTGVCRSTAPVIHGLEEMTSITLVPNVPDKTAMVTVLDTNAYRNLTFGLTLDESRDAGIRLRECDHAANEIALASPLVIWELVHHLVDQADPAYDHCLNALVALGEHCREAQNGGITLALDSEWVVCNALFEREPPGAAKNVANLAAIACHVRDHARSMEDPAVLSNIRLFSEEMVKREFSWLEGVQALLDYTASPDSRLLAPAAKSGAASLRQLVRHPDFEQAWALIGVAHYAGLTGFPLTEEQLTDRAAFFRREFSVSFRLIANLLDNLIGQNDLDLTSPKKKRGNFLWDAGICYLIPGASSNPLVPMTIVSGDKAMLSAAAAARCGESIVSLDDYLSRTGFSQNTAGN